MIKASKDSTIESLRLLDPVLTELAATGDNFAKSFNVFLTYPFVDEVVGRDLVARNLHMGDYTNLSIQMDVSVTGDDPRPADGADQPAHDPRSDGDPRQRGEVPPGGDPSSAACRKVLRNVESLAELREECRKKQNAKKDICKQVNLVPGVPRPARPAAERRWRGRTVVGAARSGRPARRLRDDGALVAQGRRCAS